MYLILSLEQDTSGSFRLGSSRYMRPDCETTPGSSVFLRGVARDGRSRTASSRVALSYQAFFGLVAEQRSEAEWLGGGVSGSRSGLKLRPGGVTLRMYSIPKRASEYQSFPELHSSCSAFL